MDTKDAFETLISKIDWWVYVVIVCMVFTIAVVINYIVKRIKDAPSEPTVNRIVHHKASTVQFQIQEETEPNTCDNTVTKQESQKRISLVFDKEDNNQEDNKKKKGEIIKDTNNMIERTLEDNKRKAGEVTEDVSNTITASERNGSSRDKYSVSVSDKSSPHSTNTIEENPVFLGKIYKDLNIKTNINIKGMSTSKELSNSKETIPITTVNQVNIDRSGESNEFKHNKIIIDKVEHNKVNIDKVEENKVEIDKVEQNKDVNHKEKQCETKAIDKVKSSDNDSILNEIVEKTVTKIRDSTKSNSKI